MFQILPCIVLLVRSVSRRRLLFTLVQVVVRYTDFVFRIPLEEKITCINDIRLFLRSSCYRWWRWFHWESANRLLAKIPLPLPLTA
jgi:hypothetical protein